MSNYSSNGSYGKVTFCGEEVLKKGLISEEEIDIGPQMGQLGIGPLFTSFDLDYDLIPEWLGDRDWYEGRIVMENLEYHGFSLLESFDRLEPWMCIETLLACEKMHRLGVSHNDLHDSNVAFNPQLREVRFLDWGLAKRDWKLVFQEACAVWREIFHYDLANRLELQYNVPMDACEHEGVFPTVPKEVSAVFREVEDRLKNEYYSDEDDFYRTLTLKLYEPTILCVRRLRLCTSYRQPLCA